MTNWSHNLYNITEFSNDTLPMHHSFTVPERKNETSLKKTELTMEEHDILLKQLQLQKKIRMSFSDK